MHLCVWRALAKHTEWVCVYVWTAFPPIQMNHDSFRNVRHYSFVVWLRNQPLTSQYIYGKSTACLYLHNCDRSQNIPVWEGSGCIYACEDNKSLDDRFNLCHAAKVPNRELISSDKHKNIYSNSCSVVSYKREFRWFIPAFGHDRDSTCGPLLLKYL